ncbi:MAG: MFS transporter [Anaerolineae bacterium]
MSTTPTPSSSGAAWSVLRYPTFRWMFAAQLISGIGSFMQLAATNWHIYKLTGDPVALGLVGLVRVLPIILLSLVGGVIADAMDRRRMMLWTQTVMLICAALLAYITISGQVTLAWIYVLTAAMAGASAFDRPAWIALMPNLAPANEIAKVARLNTVLIQITGVLGPVTAGILLGAVNPGFAYAVNALSFVPVVLALLFVRVPTRSEEQPRAQVSIGAALEGLRFIRRTPLLWSTMLLDFVATFFSSALALLPVYASDILKVGAEGYGLLYAAPSIGSVFGAIMMAQIAHLIRRQGDLLLVSVALYGVATVIFGVSTSFWLSAMALFATGLTDCIGMVIRGTLRQVITPDHLRGRMLSVNMIFFLGGPQLGEFEAGVVARVFSPMVSVVSGGIGTIIAVLWMAWSIPILRRYREVPDLAEAMD